MNARKWWSLLIIAGFFLGGCAAAVEERRDLQAQQDREFKQELEERQQTLVEKRAAFDFACQRDDLSVENLTFEIMYAPSLEEATGIFIYGVKGCGRRATYVFAGPYPILDYMQRIDGTEDQSDFYDGEAV